MHWIFSSSVGCPLVMSPVSCQYHFLLCGKLSSRYWGAVLMATDSHSFPSAENVFFHLHCWRIFSLNTVLWVNSFFQHFENAEPLCFGIHSFHWERFSHWNPCFLAGSVSFSIGCFQGFFFSLDFSDLIIMEEHTSFWVYSADGLLSFLSCGLCLLPDLKGSLTLFLPTFF